MRNTTKLVLEKKEKAVNATTAMVRLARLSNAIAFKLAGRVGNGWLPADIERA
ncbi:MAG TPA: hypothetical protein VL325_06510 [Pyrinomonadaceae bacterium]|nr:hypothetical protein [Pyrinomonadaceae bacterium]